MFGFEKFVAILHFTIMILLQAHLLETAFTKKEFYDSCASGTLCFGMEDQSAPGASPDCILTENCQVAVAVFKDDNDLKFRMIGELSDEVLDQYFGVGISFDNEMGEDIVSVCYNATSAPQYGIVFSWNDFCYAFSQQKFVPTSKIVKLPGNKYDPISNRWIEEDHADPDKASMLCEWTQFWKYTTTNGIIFDFLSDLQKFHLLLAHGELGPISQLNPGKSSETVVECVPAFFLEPHYMSASEEPILTQKSIFGKDYINNDPEPTSGTVNSNIHISFYLSLCMPMFLL